MKCINSNSLANWMDNWKTPRRESLNWKNSFVWWKIHEPLWTQPCLRWQLCILRSTRKLTKKSPTWNGTKISHRKERCRSSCRGSIAIRRWDQYRIKVNSDRFKGSSTSLKSHSTKDPIYKPSQWSMLAIFERSRRRLLSSDWLRSSPAAANVHHILPRGRVITQPRHPHSIRLSLRVVHSTSVWSSCVLDPVRLTWPKTFYPIEAMRSPPFIVMSTFKHTASTRIKWVPALNDQSPVSKSSSCRDTCARFKSKISAVLLPVTSVYLERTRHIDSIHNGGLSDEEIAPLWSNVSPPIR